MFGLSMLMITGLGQVATTSAPWRAIDWEYRTEQTEDGRVSGTSSGRESYRERIVRRRDGGLELEYDLPAAASADDRARTWQFPVRIFKSERGIVSLLNGDELEQRVSRWLAAGKIDRSACGKTVMTWTAIRIECDPVSAIGELAARGLPLPSITVGSEGHRPPSAGDGSGAFRC